MNEIKHYGVLGMKWGRRKAPSISELKRNAKYEGRLAKAQNAMSSNKEYEQNLIKSVNATTVGKLSAKVKELQANKDSEKDTIIDFHNKTLKKLQEKGQFNKNVDKAMLSKLNKELEDNDAYWDKQITKQQEKIAKTLSKQVKELKQNESYWDEQMKNTTVDSLKKDDLALGLTVGAVVLTAVGTIALNAITLYSYANK